MQVSCIWLVHVYSGKVNSIHLFLVICHRDYDREQFADNQIPLLVIGTKLDQIHETKRHEVLTRTAFLAEDFNAEEINLVCVFTNVCLGNILVKEASYFFLSRVPKHIKQIRICIKMSREGLSHFKLAHWSVRTLKLCAANRIFLEKT